MTAVRLTNDEEIVLDGRLDEAIWRRAVPATDFVQQVPHNGEPPTERTEVRIIYNKRALYMGVICFDDEPTRMLRFQRRRDEFLESDDRFMWDIDPFLTAQSGYFFETNPSGLMGDSLFSPAGGNRQWDGIWTLRVNRSEIGWTFEAEIPFSTLNFDPKSTAWGVNFQRSVRRKNEDSLWMGWGYNQGIFRLTNTGLLLGLDGDVSQGVGLDIRPYGLVVSEASPGSDAPKAQNTGKAGVDLFYSLTPGLRASVTVNTDFAQTEVDQRAVNLTRFPLFFPEKRAFFLEGANFFEFGSLLQAGSRPVDNSVTPFFSRQIGLDANGNPQKIDYGVTLTGQVGRQDVGLLQVRTAPDNGVVGEDFTALRLKRRLRQQSYVGVFYTARQPREHDSKALRTVGTDFRLATSTFRGAQNLSVGGFFLRNTNLLGTGKDAAYGLRIDYPNDRWAAGMSYRGVQENFNPAVGFTLRSGYQRYNPYLSFSPRPRNNKYVRRFGFTSDVILETDMDNQFLTRAPHFIFNVDLHTEDSVRVVVVPIYERLDRDFPIHSGVTVPRGGQYDFVRYSVTATTANRRVIAISPTIDWGGFYAGTRRQINLNVTLRARPGVIVYLANEWNSVDLPEGKFQTRVYRLTPELQFSQWVSLVNTVQYDSVSAVLGWQSRFRWILKPGNDLYVVYTQNWLDDAILNRFSTLNRRAASKVLYTRRF